MVVTRVDDIIEKRTGRSSTLKNWHIPHCPFLIECLPTVLDQIRLEVEAARNSAGGGLETGGVLLGIHEPDRIKILVCKPLQCEHAMGPGFVLSEKDEKRLTQLISAPAREPELSGVHALGWYHSHLRSRIFLSERDLQIHSRYFAASYQIALVIHPRSDGPARAGFFFHEPSGEMRAESAYEEFTIETPPATPELKPVVASEQDRSHIRTPPPAKAAPHQTQVTCPKCGSEHLRRSRRTGSIERVCGVFGFYPYRCHECLSRSFLKTSSGLLERARPGRHRRPEERKRAWQRTRREMLLWSGGILGFLAILYYLIRDTGPRPDAP
jgi:ssDNA-binding Zn-finger/Zn-ribbon topoisomerase 1